MNQKKSMRLSPAWCKQTHTYIYNEYKFVYNENQRGCPLLGANKYTHIYIYQVYMCIYIIHLFETMVSKAWPSSSVFFKIIKIIFPGLSISWILKVFRFILRSILKTLNFNIMLLKFRNQIKTFLKNLSHNLENLIYFIFYFLKKKLPCWFN